MAPDRAAATIDDSMASGEILDDVEVIVEFVDLLLSKDGGGTWQPRGSGA